MFQRHRSEWDSLFNDELDAISTLCTRHKVEIDDLKINYKSPRCVTRMLARHLVELQDLTIVELQDLTRINQEERVILIDRQFSEKLYFE